MCNKSFEGILNSAVCPANFEEHAYHEIETVIAYAQHAFFVHNAYNVQDARFANLTPAKYKTIMNRAMDNIEQAMMTAFEQATSEIHDACGEEA